jgi:hypothetical protein
VSDLAKTYRIQTRRVSRWWPMGGLIVTLVITLILFMVSETEYSYRVGKHVIAIIATGVYFFTALIVLVKAFKSAKEKGREKTKFLLTNDFLTKSIENWGDQTIDRRVISKISTNPTGVSVTQEDGNSIFIPAETESYQELLAQLSAGKQVEEVTAGKYRGLVFIAFGAGIIAPGAIAVMVFSQSTRVRNVAATVLVVTLLWNYLVYPFIKAARERNR